MKTTTMPEWSSVGGVPLRDRPAPSPTAERFEGVRRLLRAEAVLVLVTALAAFQHLGGNWWVFAALFLAPDLSFFGYAAGPQTGARVYNVVHTYLAPAALAFVGVLLRPALPLASIWVAHIALDRVLGYGLKLPSGFAETHLGGHGKKPQTA